MRGAGCFDCGASLEREWRDRKACRCPKPVGCRRYTPLLVCQHPTCAEVEHRDGCDQGGISPRWSCPGCGRIYSPQEYRLALAGSRQAETWVPIDAAAGMATKPHRTLGTWARRMAVASACRVRDRRVLVWWPDVRARSYTPGGDDDLRDRDAS